MEKSNSSCTACGGTSAEMVYPGGEEAFIGRIIDDSVSLGFEIQWVLEWLLNKIRKIKKKLRNHKMDFVWDEVPRDWE